MEFGSLFSGIGGFDLGFERAGMTCAWQVEIDPVCQRILKKHWPDVERFGDVRECTQLKPVEVVCGGFPCQPHSVAGQRLGRQDERDLWPQFRRVISELKPRWVVAENVLGLLSSEAGRYFGDILRDLALCGYDAEWEVLSATTFGAIHRRARVFVVAYAHRPGLSFGRDIAGKFFAPNGLEEDDQPTARFTDMVDCQYLSDARNWPRESVFLRKHHGLSARMDRVRVIGNAVVPQVAEWIGRRIIQLDGGLDERTRKEGV